MHHVKDEKRLRMEAAEKSSLPWIKHTQYHWSITIKGKRLDFWPSTGRYRYHGDGYHGRTKGGNIEIVEKLIENITADLFKNQTKRPLDCSQPGCFHGQPAHCNMRTCPYE